MYKLQLHYMQYDIYIYYIEPGVFLLKKTCNFHSSLLLERTYHPKICHKLHMSHKESHNQCWLDMKGPADITCQMDPHCSFSVSKMTFVIYLRLAKHRIGPLATPSINVYISCELDHFLESMAKAML